MPAMILNIGDCEYSIEAPTGEVGVEVMYGEVASLAYGGKLYIACCMDGDGGDTQIYRLCGDTLALGLEMVETDVQEVAFEGEEDGEDVEDLDTDEEEEEEDDVEEEEDDEDTEEAGEEAEEDTVEDLEDGEVLNGV